MENNSVRNPSVAVIGAGMTGILMSVRAANQQNLANIVGRGFRQLMCRTLRNTFSRLLENISDFVI